MGSIECETEWNENQETNKNKPTHTNQRLDMQLSVAFQGGYSAKLYSVLKQRDFQNLLLWKPSDPV